MCGVVDGGIVAGLWGYEAGQSGVGDIFAWFTSTSCPRRTRRGRGRRGRSACTTTSPTLAAEQEVGEHGLVALDWHQRQPLGPGRPRALRRRRRASPRDPSGGRLPRPARGHRVRHPRHPRRLPDRGRPCRGVRRRRRPGAEPLSCRSTPTSWLPLPTSGRSRAALGAAIHAAVAAGDPDIPAAAAAMGGGRRGIPAAARRGATTRSSPSTSRSTTTSAARPPCTGSGRCGARPRRSGHASHEDAERVAGRVGEDVERLVRVVGAVEEHGTAELQDALPAAPRGSRRRWTVRSRWTIICWSPGRSGPGRPDGRDVRGVALERELK